jgi:hypothetical protein
MTTHRWSAGIIVASALLATVWLARNERTPAWARPAIAIVLVVAAFLVVRVTDAWRRHAAWFSVGAVVLALIGSGFLRERTEHDVGQGGGDTIARLDVWWPLLALAVVVAVLVLVVARARPAVVPLATLALGVIIVTLLTRDVVTGHWISGRPVRRRGHVVRRPPEATDPWAHAAVEEADAVVASSNWRGGSSGSVPRRPSCVGAAAPRPTRSVTRGSAGSSPVVSPTQCRRATWWLARRGETVATHRADATRDRVVRRRRGERRRRRSRARTCCRRGSATRGNVAPAHGAGRATPRGSRC